MGLALNAAVGDTDEEADVGCCFREGVFACPPDFHDFSSVAAGETDERGRGAEGEKESISEMFI